MCTHYDFWWENTQKCCDLTCEEEAEYNNLCDEAINELWKENKLNLCPFYIKNEVNTMNSQEDIIKKGSENIKYYILTHTIYDIIQLYADIEAKLAEIFYFYQEKVDYIEEDLSLLHVLSYQDSLELEKIANEDDDPEAFTTTVYETFSEQVHKAIRSYIAKIEGE